MSDEMVELERWSALWREQESLPAREIADLRRRVRRHALAGVGSLLFGVAFLAVYTMWVWRQPEPVTWVTSVAVWVFVIAAMLFEVVNRRDTWRPRDRSTRAFLELSQLQLVRRLRGFRFGWLLLGAETLFFVPWIASTVAAAADGTPAPAEYLGPYSLLAAMVGGVAVGLWGLTKRARRELERVRSLHAWLADESRAA